MEIRSVYLVCPGKVQLKGDKRRYIGQCDVPLSEEGLKQVQELCRVLKKVNFSAAYCSDLSRSQQTAEIIITDKKIAIISRRDLREIDYGKWQGRTFREIARSFPEKFRARGADIGYYRIPGGESFADCSKRVVAAFYDILEHSEGHVLIVGDAGINRALICHILGIPVANVSRIEQDDGCLNIIECKNSVVKIKLLNYI
ncbi:Alpha-ribazole phosphatase [Sporomusa ovata DSM 2662]|uniref:Alpha-ribazole-5'-phosphate phosphatase n=1 Tax=Sporomusa ovata TaxID=2378 RepID=A0A0U1KWR8_9FIRM|nr:histidine phosphatase family protein [Sporomusa ovata]EQB28731.1 alpha-ribazole phosphatase [Sporomusa ovata DSM 2662]CQR71882.1 Alpha-ribazole-5'-phosphate phosphatase [Sporomusa ovata]